MATHQALLVKICWNSRDSTPSYNELARIIQFAWLRWWITIETAFVMTVENKNEIYVEILWISQERTAGQVNHLPQKLQHRARPIKWNTDRPAGLHIVHVYVY